MSIWKTYIYFKAKLAICIPYISKWDKFMSAKKGFRTVKSMTVTSSTVDETILLLSLKCFQRPVICF